MLASLPFETLHTVLAQCDPRTRLCLKSTCVDLKQRVLVSQSQLAVQVLMKVWNHMNYMVAPYTYKKTARMDVHFGAVHFISKWENNTVQLCIRIGDNEVMRYNTFKNHLESSLDAIKNRLELALLSDGPLGGIYVCIQAKNISMFQTNVLRTYPVPAYVCICVNGST